MDLFSGFCNICYKTNDDLKDISEENMNHLKDTLITFVGHVDIINNTGIYLCQSCGEKLTHFDEFREMCLSNLIQLRQKVLDMKSKLELEGSAYAVQNTLQLFVREEVRKNSRPVSVPAEYEIMISSASLNTEEINLQSGRNEFEFRGDCSDVSVMNSATECQEWQVNFANEQLDMPNNITSSEYTEFVKVERKSDEEFDINNDNEMDTSLIKVKEEFTVKSEIDLIAYEDFAHVKLDVGVPVINNNEASRNSGIEFTGEELVVRQDKSTAAFNTQSRHVRQHANGRVPTSRERQHAGMETYSCSVCSKTFTTSRQLIRHTRVHNRKKIYKCTVCGKAFTQSGHLTAHERTHTGDRPYECTTCKKAFTQLGNLTIHERTHSGVREHKCALCHKVLTDPSSLARHIRIHNGIKPYKCTLCPKTFGDVSHLIQHKRVHSDDRAYKCTICTKTYKQASALATHKRTHTGNRPHKCTICNKTFTAAYILVAHERTHTGDRPYKCNRCDKTFTWPSHLTVHARTHTGERPYKCIVCDKTFISSSALTAHKRVHSDVRPYECTVCNKTFTQSSYLIIHERIHSGDKPYKCTACGKSFTQSSNLKIHIRIHKVHADKI